jgi:hypothetical protein
MAPLILFLSLGEKGRLYLDRWGSPLSRWRDRAGVRGLRHYAVLDDVATPGASLV